MCAGFWADVVSNGCTATSRNHVLSIWPFMDVGFYKFRDMPITDERQKNALRQQLIGSGRRL